jgi:hypothetical protein
MLLKILSDKIKSNRWNSIQFRSKHINHPGHKKKNITNPLKFQLKDSFLNEANYPPVKPQYPPGRWPDGYDSRLAWKYFEEGEKYHSLKTVQERLSVMAYMNVQQTIDDLKIRRTKFYPIYQISSLLKSPKMLDYIQYITQTRIENPTEQKDYLSLNNNLKTVLNKKVDELLYEKLKDAVKNCILISINKQKLIEEWHQPPVHYQTYVPKVQQLEKSRNDILTNSNILIHEIINTISTILCASKTFEHLSNAQYSNDVDIKAFWKRCGFIQQKPRGAVYPDNDVIRFQFDDKASYQIKTDKPLKPVFIILFILSVYILH